MDLTELRSPDIRLWTIWEDETLLGVGALKRLSPEHGEIVECPPFGDHVPDPNSVFMTP
ncbi:hypothetical protein [Cystobacter fuscus]|uniref:hypothetical protein n=1 Tax=Cystobacter fuscus TaxID=43 RepID=UPI001E41089B|nr:hypothetical protein [Cystobacter fuscus]